MPKWQGVQLTDLVPYLTWECPLHDQNSLALVARLVGEYVLFESYIDVGLSGHDSRSYSLSGSADPRDGSVSLVYGLEISKSRLVTVPGKYLSGKRKIIQTRYHGLKTFIPQIKTNSKTNLNISMPHLSCIVGSGYDRKLVLANSYRLSVCDLSTAGHSAAAASSVADLRRSKSRSSVVSTKSAGATTTTAAASGIAKGVSGSSHGHSHHPSSGSMNLSKLSSGGRSSPGTGSGSGLYCELLEGVLGYNIIDMWRRSSCTTSSSRRRGRSRGRHSGTGVNSSSSAASGGGGSAVGSSLADPKTPSPPSVSSSVSDGPIAPGGHRRSESDKIDEKGTRARKKRGKSPDRRHGRSQTMQPTMMDCVYFLRSPNDSIVEGAASSSHLRCVLSQISVKSKGATRSKKLTDQFHISPVMCFEYHKLKEHCSHFFASTKTLFFVADCTDEVESTVKTPRFSTSPTSGEESRKKKRRVPPKMDFSDMMSSHRASSARNLFDNPRSPTRTRKSPTEIGIHKRRTPTIHAPLFMKAMMSRGNESPRPTPKKKKKKLDRRKKHKRVVKTLGLYLAIPPGFMKPRVTSPPRILSPKQRSVSQKLINDDKADLDDADDEKAGILLETTPNHSLDEASMSELSGNSLDSLDAEEEKKSELVVTRSLDEGRGKSQSVGSSMNPVSLAGIMLATSASENLSDDASSIATEEDLNEEKASSITVMPKPVPGSIDIVHETVETPVSKAPMMTLEAKLKSLNATIFERPSKKSRRASLDSELSVESHMSEFDDDPTRLFRDLKETTDMQPQHGHRPISDDHIPDHLAVKPGRSASAAMAKPVPSVVTVDRMMSDADIIPPKVERPLSADINHLRKQDARGKPIKRVGSKKMMLRSGIQTRSVGPGPSPSSSRSPASSSTHSRRPVKKVTARKRPKHVKFASENPALAGRDSRPMRIKTSSSGPTRARLTPDRSRAKTLTLKQRKSEPMTRLKHKTSRALAASKGGAKFRSQSTVSIVSPRKSGRKASVDLGPNYEVFRMEVPKAAEYIFTDAKCHYVFWHALSESVVMLIRKPKSAVFSDPKMAALIKSLQRDYDEREIPDKDRVFGRMLVRMQLKIRRGSEPTIESVSLGCVRLKPSETKIVAYDPARAALCLDTMMDQSRFGPSAMSGTNARLKIMRLNDLVYRWKYVWDAYP